jgi:glycosyltransferase involved in cell wall biosynthesis
MVLQISIPRLNVAHISTYPPRECGIALYTKDLVQSIGNDAFVHDVFAVDDVKLNYTYTCPVSFVINANDPSEYRRAADLVNESECSVVSLQHEFGIFGDEWGRHILEFIESLQKPLVTTFHTVLRDLPQLARKIVIDLSSKSCCVVVTIGKAAQILTETYNVPANKVRMIPHGAPSACPLNTDELRKRLGLSGRTIVSTVGFLSPAKGVDCAIEAMKIVVEKHPTIVFLVVGETHPTLRLHEEETYRRKLESLVTDLGLGRNVVFVNRFVSDEELSIIFGISDVYLAPYRGRDQVSSGTLTAAMAHGKAIVSTPTLFAEETLTSGRGLFCEFDDARSIATEIDRILGDPILKRGLEDCARDHGKEVEWRHTAKGYAEIFTKAANPNRKEDETISRPFEPWIQS